MSELKEGVWFDSKTNTPEDGELCLIFIQGSWGGRIALATYNEECAVWDDEDGDDYMCDLDEVCKFMRIPDVV